MSNTITQTVPKNNGMLRWFILIACVMIQTIFGGIYAWSSFTQYLVKDYGLSKGQSGFIFGLTIAVFTVAMTFSNKLIAKHGPRVTTAIAAVLFMLGYMVASFSGGSFAVLTIGIGVITGIGIGLGYVCPLSVGMKWFPNKKGLVTGVAVGGFGGGAIILSAIAANYLKEMDVLVFFRWLSIVTGVILIPASMLLLEPTYSETATKNKSVNMSVVFSPIFILLTFCIFAGTFSGLLVIGNLVQIVKTVGLTPAQAISTISIFSLGNVAGRITWGHLFDRYNFRSIPSSLALFAVMFPFLIIELPYLITFVVVGLLGFGFGANFVVYAGAISKLFGAKNFVKLYPICFLGYGFAGLVGPAIGGKLADLFGSYTSALWISTLIVAIAAVLSFFGLRNYLMHGSEAMRIV